MVATADVGRLAAELIVQNWTGHRIVELEGPTRVSPNDLAQAFAAALGHSVSVEIPSRSEWEEMFRAEGMKNPQPRIRMLDGFNEGWIEFSAQGAQAIKGETPLADVIGALVASQQKI